MYDVSPAPQNSEDPRLSEKQESFIRSLLVERELTAEQQSEAVRRLEAGLSKKKASAWIDLPDVAPGKYAVENEDGELRFYKVDRPTQGKWEGYTFLDVQHGPDSSPIKGFAAKKSILEKIAADPKGATLRYGHEIRHCGVCSIRLTNRTSRKLGIGPICGGRMFEDEFPAMKKAAREEIIAAGLDPDEEILNDEDAEDGS